MRPSTVNTPGVCLVVAGTLFLAWTVSSSAQRRNRDNTTLGLPVATNTIARNPDAYLDKLVTVSAGVERVLSKTVFIVDQRKAAGATAVKAVGTPILVVAPFLTGPLQSNDRLQIRGHLMKFGPAIFERLATRYTLDVTPDVGATYHGQPVLVADSVIDATFTELAMRPPLGPDEVAITAAMKVISPAFTALRAGAQASKADAVTENAAKIGPAFTGTAPIWTRLKLGPAEGWALEARDHVAAIERSTAAGDWEAVKASAAALNQVCQNCHGAYRERRDDGNWGLKFVLR